MHPNAYVGVLGTAFLLAGGALAAQNETRDQLPPGHWAYRECLQFSRDGWIREYPTFSFAGGRVFTRSEMAGVTDGLVRYGRAHPGEVTEERLESIRRLAEALECWETTLLPRETNSCPTTNGQVPAEAVAKLEVKIAGLKMTVREVLNDRERLQNLIAEAYQSAIAFKQNPEDPMAAKRTQVAQEIMHEEFQQIEHDKLFMVSVSYGEEK